MCKETKCDGERRAIHRRVFSNLFLFVSLFAKSHSLPFTFLGGESSLAHSLSLSLSHTHIYIYSEQHKTILAMETVIRKVLAASHLPDNDKKRAINTLLARGVPTLLKPDASLLLDLGLDLKSASVPTPFNSALYLDTLGHLIPSSINPLGLYDT